MYFKKITTEIRIRTQNHQKHARETRDAQKLNEYSTNLFSFFHFSEGSSHAIPGNLQHTILY